MKLKPVLTEKSLNSAKNGQYTFWVDINMTKFEVKELVGETFKVTVKDVKMVKKGQELKRTRTRKMRLAPSTKKAIVSLSGKDKIDLFEEVASAKE